MWVKRIYTAGAGENLCKLGGGNWPSSNCPPLVFPSVLTGNFCFGHLLCFFPLQRTNGISKSWIAFLQGFLSINPAGRVNWGNFSFYYTNRVSFFNVGCSRASRFLLAYPWHPLCHCSLDDCSLASFLSLFFGRLFFRILYALLPWLTNKRSSKVQFL